MSDYPVNSTARVFTDSDGNECTLYQLVSREPLWAKNRIIDLEISEKRLQRKIEQLQSDRAVLLEALERIEGMAERPSCICGKPTGTAAIKSCANQAIEKVSHE